MTQKKYKKSRKISKKLKKCNKRTKVMRGGANGIKAPRFEPTSIKAPGPEVKYVAPPSIKAPGPEVKYAGPATPDPYSLKGFMRQSPEEQRIQLAQLPVNRSRTIIGNLAALKNLDVAQAAKAAQAAQAAQVSQANAREAIVSLGEPQKTRTKRFRTPKTGGPGRGRLFAGV